MPVYAEGIQYDYTCIALEFHNVLRMMILYACRCCMNWVLLARSKVYVVGGGMVLALVVLFYAAFFILVRQGAMGFGRRYMPAVHNTICLVVADDRG